MPTQPVMILGTSRVVPARPQLTQLAVPSSGMAQKITHPQPSSRTALLNHHASETGSARRRRTHAVEENASCFTADAASTVS